MDKNILYKLPKDLLVELVCKNFDNVSCEQMLEIYQKKAENELIKKKEFLSKKHLVPNTDIFIELDSRIFIFQRESGSLDIEVLLPRGMQNCIFINIDGRTIGCKDENEMTSCLNEILGENFNQNIVNNIISLFLSLIRCYYDRKRIKKSLKFLD